MLITTNVINRAVLFEDETFTREAIEHLYRVRKEHPFFLFGFVIMPDHCHFLMRVLSPETISNIMRIYKMGLTFQFGIGPFWQSRFHIRIPKNPKSALQYIHMNPVRAELVDEPENYSWSSASGRWDVDLSDV